MDLGYLGETLRISHAAGTNPSPRTQNAALERSGIFFESEGGVLVFCGGWRSGRFARDRFSPNMFLRFCANPSIGTFPMKYFWRRCQSEPRDFERSDIFLDPSSEILSARIYFCRRQSDPKEFLNEHLTILNIVFSSLDILPPLLG